MTIKTTEDIYEDSYEAWADLSAAEPENWYGPYSLSHAATLALDASARQMGV